MQIKEGKCYRNREGKKIGPMIYDPYKHAPTYCWRTASDFEGRWDDQGNDGNAPSGVYSLTDLVSEYALPNVGTLEEIGAEVGDVVAIYNSCHDGTETIVRKNYKNWEGSNEPWWSIVSKARVSPVRTVTRKEIISGLYGKVSIHEIPSDKGGVRLAFVNSITDVMRTIHTDLSPTELREAIETLSTIADALENE